MSATGVITTVGIVVATSESAALISRHSLSMRPIIGGFVLGIFLFGIEAATPSLSSSVMGLIIVSALLINGASLLSLLNAAPRVAKS